MQWELFNFGFAYVFQFYPKLIKVYIKWIKEFTKLTTLLWFDIKDSPVTFLKTNHCCKTNLKFKVSPNNDKVILSWVISSSLKLQALVKLSSGIYGKIRSKNSISFQNHPKSHCFLLKKTWEHEYEHLYVAATKTIFPTDTLKMKF